MPLPSSRPASIVRMTRGARSRRARALMGSPWGRLTGTTTSRTRSTTGPKPPVGGNRVLRSGRSLQDAQHARVTQGVWFDVGQVEELGDALVIGTTHLLV